MTVKPERVNLSWTSIGNVFISSTDPTTAYVRADVVDELLKEQRQMCRLAGMGAAQEYSLSDSARLIHEVGEAIINATGEENEQLFKSD